MAREPQNTAADHPATHYRRPQILTSIVAIRLPIDSNPNLTLNPTMTSLIEPSEPFSPSQLTPAASELHDGVSETADFTDLDAAALSDLQFASGISSEASSEAESEDSNGPAPKKRKIRAVNTWNYCRERKPGEPERKANRRVFYCKYCKNWSSNVTTNIRKHLRDVHSLIVVKDQSFVKKAAEQHIKNILAKQGEIGIRSRAEKDRALLQSVIKKEVVFEAMVQLIVMRNISFNAATWPELRGLLLSVNAEAGDVLNTSYSSIPAMITRSYEANKTLLKEKLRDATSLIHLAIDVWSSPNRKNFLAIVAQFVDQSFTLRKALLSLPWLPTSHGAEDQEDPLWRTLKEYNIKDRISYFVGDNYRSNDLLLRRLGRRLNEVEKRSPGGPQFDAMQRRIRCHGHVINLAVQAFFFCEDKAAVDAAFKEARQQLEV